MSGKILELNHYRTLLCATFTVGMSQPSPALSSSITLTNNDISDKSLPKWGGKRLKYWAKEKSKAECHKCGVSASPLPPHSEEAAAFRRHSQNERALGHGLMHSTSKLQIVM